MIQKEQIKQQLQKFIEDYQASLGSSDCRKMPEQMIPVITVQDLIYKFKWDCSLREFKDFMNDKENEDIKVLVQDFVSNNFIHYACSTKMKELLQEYKESNVVLEKDIITFDVNNIDTFNGLGISLDHSVSLNCNLASDIDGADKDKVLSTVEKFNQDNKK